MGWKSDFNQRKKVAEVLRFYFFFFLKDRSQVSLLYGWTCQKLFTPGEPVFLFFFNDCGPVPGEVGYSWTVGTWSESICLQWNEAEKLERSAWTGTDWETQRAGNLDRGCLPWEHIKDYIMHSLPQEMVSGNGTMATDVMARWPWGWPEWEFEFEVCWSLHIK